MPIYALGPFRLDTQNGLLSLGTAPVALGRRAVALLQALVERPGALVSKDVLIEAAWSGQAVEDSNLTVQMAALRRALGEAPGGGGWIETMPRRGYRFVGPVVASDENAATEVLPRVDASRAATLVEHGETERRQITALACQPVGLAAGSGGMDLEDLREALGEFQRGVSETAHRHRGFIARCLGPDVLVLFGYPETHEHDAERAVRAGLELCAASTILGANAGLPRRCRVGVATGTVIIGDSVAVGAFRDKEVVGDVPHLAARLLVSAQPDTMAIDAVTRRLIGNLFDCREIGEINTNGDAEPKRAWRVLGESGVVSRFEALRSEATPLVGRDEELALLLRRWDLAKSGEGRVVLVSGEPGIGKSRLTAALWQRISEEPHTRLRYFCSPHHQDSALHPFIVQLERAAGFARDDTIDRKLGKLRALLAPGAQADDEIELLAELLSLPNSVVDLHLSPRRKREKLFAALLHQLEALARSRPVLMVFEDAHWIDSSSRELLDMTLARVSRTPVLLVVTFRAEFQHSWSGQPFITELALNRLRGCDGAVMVNWIAGNKVLSAEIVRQIVDHTDGVPLFLEELTKAVLETGDSDAIGGVASAPMLAIPATLHASLMARLDHLGPAAKQVTQIAAAVGREFSYELLSAIEQRPGAELQAALGELVDAGLAFCRGLPPQATYLFKHALVQDAAYGTLLRARRQELHGAITKALEERFPETVELQPEILAYHCTQAGWIKKAIAYWGRAGRRSLARSAMIETVAQVRLGLDLLAYLPEIPERWRAELDLQRVLGAALLASKGNAAPETAQAYARSRELCEQLGDTAALIPVLGALSTYHQTAGEYSVMRGICEDLLRIGEQRDDTAGSLVGSRSMGLCLYHLGEFAAARPHLERVLDLYTPEAHDALVTVTSFDVLTGALSYLSMLLCIQGHYKQAASFSRQALTVSRNLRNPHNRVFSLNYAAVSKLLGRAEPAAEELLQELLSLASEHGFSVWLATANIMHGYIVAGGDEPEAGLALARKGWADRAATGSQYHGTYYLGLLAQTCERAGRIEEALAFVDTALEMADRMRERWFEAELWRLKAEWLLVYYGDERQRAATCFDRALAVAREQKARLWELRAASSLARLWYAQGKRDEARDLLAPASRWFTEGFDMPDLKEATALLDALR